MINERQVSTWSVCDVPFYNPAVGTSATTRPGAIASANGPRAAAFSISNRTSDRQPVRNQVCQARAHAKMIDQVTKPPEPGWKSAMNQISDTVDHMEKGTFCALRFPLACDPGDGQGRPAVYPSGVAMQQSGGMPDGLKSAAEAPADNATPVATPTVPQRNQRRRASSTGDLCDG